MGTIVTGQVDGFGPLFDQSIDRLYRKRGLCLGAGKDIVVLTTNLRRDTFRHFGSIAIPQARKT
jgi:hypothetical protein